MRRARAGAPRRGALCKQLPDAPALRSRSHHDLCAIESAAFRMVVAKGAVVGQTAPEQSHRKIFRENDQVTFVVDRGVDQRADLIAKLLKGLNRPDEILEGGELEFVPSSCLADYYAGGNDGKE